MPGFTGLITERVALFQNLHDHYDLRLRHAWRALTATIANREDAVLLDVPPSSQVMRCGGANIDDDLVPTMYLRRRLRGDRIGFTMRYDSA